MEERMLNNGIVRFQDFRETHRNQQVVTPCHAKCLSSASDDVDRVSLGTADGPVDKPSKSEFGGGATAGTESSKYRPLTAKEVSSSPGSSKECGDKGTWVTGTPRWSFQSFAAIGAWQTHTHMQIYIWKNYIINTT